MAEVKRILRPVLSVVLIGASVLGLLNVFGDNAEEEAAAKRLACGAQSDCDAQITRLSRTPLGQSFTFGLGYEGGKRGQRPTEVSVSCKRAYVLLGSWACAIE